MSLKEKQQLDNARLAVYEYFSSNTDEPLLVRARKQRELASEVQRAEKAYEAAYARQIRNKFLQLGNETI
jgi:hypothetical protein